MPLLSPADAKQKQEEARLAARARAEQLLRDYRAEESRIAFLVQRRLIRPEHALAFLQPAQQNLETGWQELQGGLARLGQTLGEAASQEGSVLDEVIDAGLVGGSFALGGPVTGIPVTAAVGFRRLLGPTVDRMRAVGDTDPNQPALDHLFGGALDFFTGSTRRDRELRAVSERSADEALSLSIGHNRRDLIESQRTGIERATTTALSTVGALAGLAVPAGALSRGLAGVVPRASGLMAQAARGATIEGLSFAGAELAGGATPREAAGGLALGGAFGGARPLTKAVLGARAATTAGRATEAAIPMTAIGALTYHETGDFATAVGASLGVLPFALGGVFRGKERGGEPPPEGEVAEAVGGGEPIALAPPETPRGRMQMVPVRPSPAEAAAAAPGTGVEPIIDAMRSAIGDHVRRSRGGRWRVAGIPETTDLPAERLFRALMDAIQTGDVRDADIPGPAARRIRRAAEAIRPGFLRAVDPRLLEAGAPPDTPLRTAREVALERTRDVLRLVSSRELALRGEEPARGRVAIPETRPRPEEGAPARPREVRPALERELEARAEAPGPVAAIEATPPQPAVVPVPPARPRTGVRDQPPPPASVAPRPAVGPLPEPPPRPVEGEPRRPSATTIITPDRRRIPAEWQAVEADAVRAALVEGEAQPRDRTRTASDAQIRQIAGDPDYDLLSDSKGMEGGAPTLSAEGVLVAGNGRFEGVTLAYRAETASRYRAALEADAGRFGLDAEQIRGMKAPILVRRLSPGEDIRRLAIESNKPLGLELAPMEHAALDAERMVGLERVDVTDSGDIPMTAQNRAAISAAMKDYSAPELAGMMTAEGELSQAGLRRVRNALLYKAYGKSETLAKLLESADPEMRNVGTALVRASGSMRELRDAIRAEEVPAESDLAPDLTQAIETLSGIRARGEHVKDFLAQRDMFDGGLTEAGRALLPILADNARSARRLTEFLHGYARLMVDAGRARGGLFGDADLPSKLEGIERASKDLGAKAGPDPAQPELELGADTPERPPAPSPSQLAKATQTKPYQKTRAEKLAAKDAALTEAGVSRPKATIEINSLFRTGGPEDGKFTASGQKTLNPPAMGLLRAIATDIMEAIFGVRTLGITPPEVGRHTREALRARRAAAPERRAAAERGAVPLRVVPFSGTVERFSGRVRDAWGAKGRDPERLSRELAHRLRDITGAEREASRDILEAATGKRSFGDMTTAETKRAAKALVDRPGVTPAQRKQAARILKQLDALDSAVATDARETAARVDGAGAERARDSRRAQHEGRPSAPDRPPRRPPPSDGSLTNDPMGDIHGPSPLDLHVRQPISTAQKWERWQIGSRVVQPIQNLARAIRQLVSSDLRRVAHDLRDIGFKPTPENLKAVVKLLESNPDELMLDGAPNRGGMGNLGDVASTDPVYKAAVLFRRAWNDAYLRFHVWDDGLDYVNRVILSTDRVVLPGQKGAADRILTWEEFRGTKLGKEIMPLLGKRYRKGYHPHIEDLDALDAAQIERVFQGFTDQDAIERGFRGRSDMIDQITSRHRQRRQLEDRANLLEDPIAAFKIYERSVARSLLTPTLRETSAFVRDKLGPINSQQAIQTRKWLAEWSERMLGTPTSMEIALAQSFSHTWSVLTSSANGYLERMPGNIRLPTLNTPRVLNMLTHAGYMGALGLRPDVPIRNILTQLPAAFARLGTRYTLAGFRDWLEASGKAGGEPGLWAFMERMRRGGDELRRAGVVEASGFSEIHGEIGGGSGIGRAWEKMQAGSMFLFDGSEVLLRSVSYFGGRRKFLAGMEDPAKLRRLIRQTRPSARTRIQRILDGDLRLEDEVLADTEVAKYLKGLTRQQQAAHEYAFDINAQTQFMYAPENSPMMTRNSAGRALFQFQSYTVNMAEFWRELARGSWEGRKEDGLSAALDPFRFVLGTYAGLYLASMLGDMDEEQFGRLKFDRYTGDIFFGPIHSSMVRGVPAGPVAGLGLDLLAAAAAVGSDALMTPAELFADRPVDWNPTTRAFEKIDRDLLLFTGPGLGLRQLGVLPQGRGVVGGALERVGAIGAAR